VILLATVAWMAVSLVIWLLRKRISTIVKRWAG